MPLSYPYVMIPYPEITPEIFTFGRFKIRWYGLMYVMGFWLGFQVLRNRAKRGLLTINYRECESMVTYLIVGMLVGARLVYALVYNWDFFAQQPIKIFYLWEGGLSFHGAMIGMVLACWAFCRKHKLPYHMVTDAFAVGAAPGLFFGRMGNFINAELYGRRTDVPWAMIFPTDPDRLPRHPSQLYQGLSEGILLFVILWVVQNQALKRGKYRLGLLGCVFLIGYGCIRFTMEFFREPDVQLGFVLGPFSMGQLLCFLMILWGVFEIFHHRKNPYFVPKAPSKEFLESAG